jgi:very-short-patch-repair endonuclease
VLGNFSFLKLAIVQDLRTCGDLLAAHTVIAALAGSPDARAALHSNREPIDPHEFDRLPPDLEYLVVDADSSQQRVITAVLRGQHCVIQGPPGTGKSQTIANLIAALVAEGKRVLFVAEKRAALEVVLRRLQHVGLGHLALDLHGADVARSAVVRRFAENLDLVRTTAAVDATEVHQHFCNRRWRLNQHVTRLHTPRSPSGLSVYTLQGRLLRVTSEAHTVTRWRGEQLKLFTAETIAHLSDALVELGGFEDLFRRTSTSRWVGVPISNGRDAQATIDLVARLLHELLPALRGSLQEIARMTGLPEATRLDAVPVILDLLSEAAAVLATYKDEIFQTNLSELAEHLAGAKPSFIHAGVQFLFNRAYREAETRANQLRRSPVNGIQRGPTLAAEIERAANLLQRWRDTAPLAAHPRAYPQLDRTQAQFQAVQTALDELATRLGTADVRQHSFGELVGLLAQLNADGHTAYRVARMHELLAALHQSGLGALLYEIQASATPPGLWPRQLEHAWLASCLDQILAEDTELAGFSGDGHARFVTEFRDLDRRRLEIAANRVRRAHAERVIAVMNAHPDQEDLVRREAAKRKRHLPLRALLARAPDVLTSLCPCWMASPLSVSQLIDARQTGFDVVIFDEASQVLPEDAAAALLRGRQVVVAGDRHQLPPTRFFISGEDDDADEEVAPTEGFESLLDLLSAQLDSWSLDWHYRSRDESLIAFSNRHIYSDRLITFPGANAAGAITHELVPWTSDLDSQDESSSAEVTRVVGLILQHAATRPQETLGVITMGIKHAQRIEAALDQALRDRRELEPFFSTTGTEPFFVKNLERVQGDERDAIILSVGYGKDRSGKLAYRFGPLLTAGGERRLNVAVTRARCRLTLVSSFSHLDMDPARSQARGVELLRHYLEYAASGGRHLSTDGRVPIPLNPFEADVYDALRARDIPLVPQWGVSSYRLDFAAQHPQKPGQFVLAIECDGATYHSAPTARDRDRLRQQHLEALGWRFHRIWSQDWFTKRTNEIDRAVRAFELAIRDADSATDPIIVAASAMLDKPAQLPAPTAPANKTRGPRPPVPRYLPITEYLHRDLVALVQWVQSDGRLRTDDEILDEVVRDLGFQRRGPRIVATIRAVIAAAKQPIGRR